MADVQYVTVTLSDGTPVQVVAGTPLHELYLALAGFTTPAAGGAPDIDLTTLRPMAWFMTPHGPQSVIEPATIAEFLRRDYLEITAQQAADYFAGAADIPDVSFVTGQELAAELAARDTEAIPDSRLPARLGDASLKAAFGTPVERAILTTGRRVGYLGDSFTVGAGASNVIFAYVTRSQIAAGTAYVDNTSPVNAVGGRTSADALAALPDLLALNPDVVFVLIGTNDSGTAVPVATFANNLKAIYDQTRAAGKPLIVGTVPPRAAAATAAQKALIDGYNAWLRLWAPSAGVRLVDSYAALADPATGGLLAAYNSGDGVHPNNAGHLALGIAVGKALAAAAGPLPLPAFPSEGNLVTNPLMAGAGTEATDWFPLTGNVTTTYALEADTTGRLPYGRWQSMALTSEGYRQYVTECKKPGRINPGDELLFTAYLNIVDLGGWAANPGNGKIGIFDQDVVLKTNPIDDPRMLQPGPVMYRYTAPAGMTGAFIGLVGDVPAGVSAKYQIGAVCLYNLTALGLAGVI